MSEILDNVKSMYEAYNGSGQHLLLFWLCVLILAIWNSKKKHVMNSFLIVLVVVLLCVFVCPITAKIIMAYCIGYNTYWRMVWLFPVTLVIGCVLTEFVYKVKEKKYKLVVLFGMFFLINCTGKSVYQDMSIVENSSLSKLPLSVEAVCEEIKEFSVENNVEEIITVMPNEFLPYVRQYDATIKMPYGRNGERYGGSGKHKMYYLVNEKPMNYEEVSRLCKGKGYNYLVLQYQENDTVRTEMQNVGFEYISSVQGYDIFYMGE